MPGRVWKTTPGVSDMTELCPWLLAWIFLGASIGVKETWQNDLVKYLNLSLGPVSIAPKPLSSHPMNKSGKGTNLKRVLSSRSILCNLSSLSRRLRSRSADRDSWCCLYDEASKPPRASLQHGRDIRFKQKHDKWKFYADRKFLPLKCSKYKVKIKEKADYLSGLLSVGDPPVETKRLKGVEGALDALNDLPGYVPA